MPPPGAFIDTSEYRRLNFNLQDRRLVAAKDLATAGKVSLLSTTISVREVKSLMGRSVAEAYSILKGGNLAPLKSIPDHRLNLIREPPVVKDLVETWEHAFDEFLGSSAHTCLDSGVADTATIFDDSFGARPPFDTDKKKSEFPDAFTLKTLEHWARDNNQGLYVIGPDRDLKRYCEANDGIEYFEKIEAFLDHANRQDVSVQDMDTLSADVEAAVAAYVEDNFDDLEFTLKYNTHGEVGSLDVDYIEIEEIYALEVTNGSVNGEADVRVEFTAGFSYEDYDNGYYDNESGTWLMLETVEGQAQDATQISVGFMFTKDVGGNAVITDLEIQDRVVEVEEEDRGDYGAYK